MSLIGTVANYGGRQPSNLESIKQFVVGVDSYAVWVYKKLPTGLSVQTPANNKYPLYINSDLYVTGSIFNTSDLLLKENIINLSETTTTTDLFNLNPVKYSFKSDINKKQHYGFIAQDVEKIFPELVKDSVLGYKTVNYIELIPMIISKMKSMQNEIDELKLKTQELRDDIR
jgi:hypothetical protein